MAQVVDDHFGRSKDLIATTVATLEDFQDYVVWLRWIVCHTERLMTVRIKLLAKALLRFNAVLAEELVESVTGVREVHNNLKVAR